MGPQPRRLMRDAVHGEGVKPDFFFHDFIASALNPTVSPPQQWHSGQDASSRRYIGAGGSRGGLYTISTVMAETLRPSLVTGRFYGPE
jgi:hypothetical protein